MGSKKQPHKFTNVRFRLLVQQFAKIPPGVVNTHFIIAHWVGRPSGSLGSHQSIET